jgi:signal transduction histidine kinase/ActR/RegA family two-component response regulator
MGADVDVKQAIVERNRLRKWLYLVLSLLAVAPLVVVGAVLIWHSLKTQEEYALAMQSNLSRQAADEIHHTIEELENDLTKALQLLDFFSINKERQGILLSALRAKADRNNRNIITELILVDKEGRQLARTSRDDIFLESDLANPVESKEFQIPVESGMTYYSPVWFDEKTGDPRMVIGVPLFNIGSLELEAVLIARLRLKELWEIVTGLPIGRTGIAYMVSDAGRIIAHPNPSLVLRGDTFTVPVSNGLHDGHNGNNVVLVNEPLQFGDQPFVIVTEMPVAEALNLTIHHLGVIVICIALALVASAVLWYLIKHRIVMPVENVTQAAIAISNGDYSSKPIQTKLSGEDDEIGYLAATFNLMAKRIQAREYDLRHAMQEVEASSRVKTEFLATMSHEIRTPMNGVLGFARLLRHTELSAEQRDYLDTIEKSGNALLILLNDILDFSSIEAERLALHHGAFNPKECIEAVIKLMAPEAKRKGLRLTFDYPDKDATWLAGDESRLRQVMLNLVSNAVKFSDQGEVTINVELQRADVGYRALKIEVKDSGIGISKEMQEKLFNPFTQGDSSSTRKYGGTGLGLAICKRLVNLMGGEIGVDSEPGMGATFWVTVTLPETPAVVSAGQQADESHSTAAAESSAAPHFSGHVLLVEDETSNQLLAKIILEQLGFDVIIASNGKEAIQKLKQARYDLVLMDWQMPEMDGYQATEIIRSEGQDIPIIAVTANAMSYDRQRCIDTGMNDYIAKPFKKEAMMSVLSRWLPDNNRPN